MLNVMIGKILQHCIQANYEKVTRCFFILLVMSAIASFCSAQDNFGFNVSCEVHKVYSSVSLKKTELDDISTLKEINEYYESHWVKEYISVEVSAFQKGRLKKARSDNDELTSKQLDLIRKADLGTDITVTVDYLPENNLKSNETKEMGFTFSIDPDNDALFPNGHQSMIDYFKTHAVDKISLQEFEQYQLAAYKFVINEHGLVENPSVFWSSDDSGVDTIILNAICNMPTWEPAHFSEGPNVAQEFVLALGDMKSCVINLLNIRHD